MRKDQDISHDKPVIVYGASGYTGRLICEYLREYNVPFVAAGRDKARIAEALDSTGIDTIEHDIVEVSHDIEPLTELFGGASVVCNTVGPFGQYGTEVVEAIPGRRMPLPGHHRRTGLADHLRRQLRAADGGRGPAARARRRADVHHR